MRCHLGATPWLIDTSVEGSFSVAIPELSTDNSEPGSSDSIGITLWKKDGGLFFSSKLGWDPDEEEDPERRELGCPLVH